MSDRNTNQALDKDIDFIDEILESLSYGNIVDAVSHLEDWKDELKALQSNEMKNFIKNKR